MDFVVTDGTTQWECRARRTGQYYIGTVVEVDGLRQTTDGIIKKFRTR